MLQQRICSRFNLHKLADWDHYILKIVVSQDANRLSFQLGRKMSSVTSNQLIVLDPLLEGSSGRNSAVTCNIMVPVSFRMSMKLGYRLTIIVGTSSAEYLKSVARREIDWINSHANPQEPNQTPWQYMSPQQKSPEAHTALLEKFLATIPYITPKDPELASPRLWHPDFHAGNIYIDDQDRISCIIDWQGAWTTPVFIGANPPLLLDYGIDMLMKLPENFRALDDATKDKLRYQVSQSVLIHTYETSTAERNPLMYKVMRHPHGQTLKQLEAFVGSTWDNCLFPFEECLIRVERCVDLLAIKLPG